ncbi:hypothetical protein AHAS_Ahas05G0062700 [Arachis hypogaea]
MSSPIAGNEFIRRLRSAPDAIRLASQIRQSSDITSANFYFLQALILQMKYVEHDLYTWTNPVAKKREHLPPQCF